METEPESRPRGSGARRRRRRTRVPTRLGPDIGSLLVVGSLLVAALGFGAQHVTVLIASVALAVASAVLAPKDTRVPLVAWLLLGLAGYSLLQALPLPLGVVRALSPEAASVWEGALRPLRPAGSSWASLSVDPAGTWLEVLKFAGYACVVIGASALRARHGSRSVLALVGGLALLVCVVTLAHGLVGATRIYGMFPAPNLHERWSRGPFVNGNNLAGYLNLGLFAGVGLLLGERPPLRTRYVGAGVAVLATGLVLTGSRGGVLCAVLGGAVLVAYALKRRGAGTVRIVAGSSLVLLVAVVALFVFGDTRLRGALFDTSNAGKILGFRGALSLIHDNPWFGVGRGAFDGAFQPYRGVRGDASTVYVHAENLVLDWMSEWGVLVGLVALFGCGFFLVRLVTRAKRDPALVGVVLAVGAVLLQNQVDFGLELFGLAAPFWILLSLGERGYEQPGAKVAVWPRFVPAGAAVAAVLVVLVTRAQPLQLERRAMRERFTAFGAGNRAALAELQRELRAAILRHPADGYLPLLGGHLAARLRQNPLVWLGRALERTPTSGRANLALAEALGAAGHRGQALIHLRLAGAYDYSLADRAGNVAVALESNVEALARGYPRDSIGGERFVELCPKLPAGSRLPCFREAVRRDASRQAAHAGLVQELLAALDAGREPCGGGAAPACVVEAKRSVASMKAGSGFQTVMLAARVRALEGDRAGAVKILLGECHATPSASGCLELAVELAIGLSDRALVREAIGRYTAVACEAPERCGAAHEYVADRLDKSGDLGGALEHQAEAARQAPSAGAWLKLAGLRARLGTVATVRAALDEAKASGPLDEAQRREVLRLERVADQR
jgi:O-antigen ligase